MPTYEWERVFGREFAALDNDSQKAFLAAVAQFVEDLQHGRPARRSLRVKSVRGHDGVFEMTWAANGRATFAYGEEQSPGQAHVIWRRIGSHDIFRRP